MFRVGLCCGVFDDVNGRRRGRQKAELLSADTRGTTTIRYVYIMPGAGFAFGKPTLAEISLKMSIACVEWDSCTVCLMTSEAAEMAEKRLIYCRL